MEHATDFSRRPRAAGAAAIVVAVLFVAAVAGAHALRWTSLGFRLTDLWSLPPLLTTQGVGLLIAVRRPENRVGWLVCALGLVLAVQTLLAAFIASSPPAGWWSTAALWVDGKSFLFLWGAVIAVLLHFPTGSLPSPRWRLVPWAAATAIAWGIAFGAFAPGPLAEAVPAGVVNPTNPTALPPEIYDRIVFLEPIGLLLLVAALVAAISSLVARYRASHRIERLQIRWVVAACVAFVTALLLNVVVRHAVPSALDAADAVVGVAFTLIPISVGIAILRRRLYDIDRVVNRTVVYTLLTAVLALAYGVGVTTARAATEPLTGDSSLAVAASTLFVAALFQPVRRRIQRGVDRRFNRARYDAAATIHAFAGTLRTEVDVETLREDLLAVVQATMHPSTAAVWLRQVPS